ncbi:MAG: hypothetical protein ACE5KV_07585 [Thermoplasmata archaeon]
MRTYVTVYVSSEGEKASEVAEKMREMGFRTTLGTFDFVYEWTQRDVPSAKVIEFVDKVQARLNGSGALLHFTTIR